MIAADQLRAKVCENNTLSPQQQNELCGVLIKYQQHLTKRPGRCNAFECEFKIEGDHASYFKFSANNVCPESTSSRPDTGNVEGRDIRRIIFGLCQPANTNAPWTETYLHLRGCTKNKQAVGSESRYGTAYVRIVTEISWIKFGS